MGETATKEFNLVCVASDFKGNALIESAKAAGCHVRLVTKQKYKNERWPFDAIDELHTVGDDATPADYLRAVVGLARSRPVHHVVGLDEFDVLTTAEIREFLCLKRGLSVTQARLFRDKLEMRFAAQSAEIPQPEFVPLFNSTAIAEYARRVPAPWIIKPRTEVSAYGIRKLHDEKELWDNLRELDVRDKWRDHPSQFLLERFVPGKVFHVDSLIWNNEPVFSGVSNYGTPPFAVTHQGGVFTTSLLPYESDERLQLLQLNRKLIDAFGIERGVTHAEFLRSDASGEFFLLEVAARVGGAYIAEALAAGSNINIWREWARIEIADAANPYQLPDTRREYAGVVLSLANAKNPDTSAYIEPEIVQRIVRPHHVGFVVQSPDYDRVQTLLNSYAKRFIQDFTVRAPARERHDL